VLQKKEAFSKRKASIIVGQARHESFFFFKETKKKEETKLMTQHPAQYFHFETAKQ
jgi:hypothetical protein